jgi:hypothetical protein
MIEYTQFYKKWFGLTTPVNAKKATATLTFSDVVSDGDEVSIGDIAYEFDRDSNLENGLAVDIDMTDVLIRATATLTFIGIPVAAETVTIGAGEDIEVYEFVADAEDIADPANIPVVLGETFTADAAVTELADAVNSSSLLVDAVSDTDDDTVLFTAKVGGTGANTTAVSTTATNASFGVDVTTLSGGANTVSAADAASVLADAINANENEVVTAEADGGTVVVSYKIVGTEGNSMAVDTDATNGSWGEDVITLSGGQFATPVSCACFIKIGNNYYVTNDAVTKFDTDGWYVGAPA